MEPKEPLKIRSMACLMKPANFQERPLKPHVIKRRLTNGYVNQDLRKKSIH